VTFYNNFYNNELSIDVDFFISIHVTRLANVENEPTVISFLILFH